MVTIHSNAIIFTLKDIMRHRMILFGQSELSIFLTKMFLKCIISLNWFQS